MTDFPSLLPKHTPGHRKSHWWDGDVSMRPTSGMSESAGRVLGLPLAPASYSELL